MEKAVFCIADTEPQAQQIVEGLKAAGWGATSPVATLQPGLDAPGRRPVVYRHAVCPGQFALALARARQRRQNVYSISTVGITSARSPSRLRGTSAFADSTAV
jgi:hypothetical protein